MHTMKTALGLCVWLLFLSGVLQAQQSHTVIVVDGTMKNVVFTAPANETEWEWMLTVNAGEGWEHIVPSQKPHHSPWLPHFDPASGYWLVSVTPDSPEQHFQILFSGALRPIGQGGEGEGEPVVGKWQIDGRTDSEYYVLPELTYAPVGRTVTLRAEDGDGNPVASRWTVSPTDGVSPTTLPDGATVSFTSTLFKKYVVTGASLSDPTLSDSARVSYYSAVIETVIPDKPGNAQLTDNHPSTVFLKPLGEVDPFDPPFVLSAVPKEKGNIINKAGTAVEFYPTVNPLVWHTSKIYWYGIEPDFCCYTNHFPYRFTLHVDGALTSTKDFRVGWPNDARSYADWYVPERSMTRIHPPELTPGGQPNRFRCRIEFMDFYVKAEPIVNATHQYRLEVEAEERFHVQQDLSEVSKEQGGWTDFYKARGLAWALDWDLEGPWYAYGDDQQTAWNNAKKYVEQADEKEFWKSFELQMNSSGYAELKAKQHAGYNAAFKYHCVYEPIDGPNPINHVHPAYQ